MFINNDIDEYLNKFLDLNSILLLRQTSKNNNFKILENLKIIRNININDKIVFNDDKYLLMLNLYIDDIKENILLRNSSKDIIDKIHIINIVEKKYEKKNLNIVCDFLKKLDNIKNLNKIILNINIVSSLNRYINKNEIKLFNNLEYLIIDIYNIEENNILLCSNIIIEFLKKINIKNLYFKNCIKEFKKIFNSYFNYIYNYENMDKDLIIKYI